MFVFINECGFQAKFALQLWKRGQVMQFSKECWHEMKHGPPVANDAYGLCYHHVDFPHTRYKRVCDSVYEVYTKQCDVVYCVLCATVAALGATMAALGVMDTTPASYSVPCKKPVSHTESAPRKEPHLPAPRMELSFWGKLCRDPQQQDALLLAVLKTMLLVVSLALLAAYGYTTGRALRHPVGPVGPIGSVGPTLKCFDFATTTDEETVRSLMHDLGRRDGIYFNEGTGGVNDMALSEDGSFHTDAPANTWCAALSYMSYGEVRSKLTRMQVQREYTRRAFDWETPPIQGGCNCEFIL